MASVIPYGTVSVWIEDESEDVVHERVGMVLEKLNELEFPMSVSEDQCEYEQAKEQTEDQAT